MHKFFHKKSERGRSLLEIIAVLVIMAILLIAALIGFKTLLDYLRKRETANQITTIGMRYKTDRLGKVRKGDRKVSLKEVYPEGNGCEKHKNDSTCIQSSDGGEIRLYAYEDTTSFVVVATDISPISCEEAILSGGYTKVINGIKDDGWNFINSEFVYNSETGDFKDVEYFKEHPHEIYDFCRSGVAFVYTDSDKNCQYFYDGKCHDCPKGQAADKEGKCCPSEEIDCELCGGCKGGFFCSAKRNFCVECNQDEDCKSKYGMEKPYCNKDGICVSCRKIGDECKDASGTGLGLWCDADLKCTKACEGKSDRWIPNPANITDCICNNKTKIERFGACDITTDSTCKDECKLGLECKDSLCVCPDPLTLNEGAPCTGECPCGTAEDGAELTCRNGTCQRAQSTTCGADGYPEPRNKGNSCKSDCLCNETAQKLLRCVDSKCQCDALPIKQGDDCWGECGCGVGLKCNKTGAQKGICQCDSNKPALGDTCTKECGCAAGLKCSDSFICECDPPANSKTLSVGQACANETVCPNQCKDSECRNGKCCPAPKGFNCKENIYDINGCVEYEYRPCSDGKKCSLDGTQCVGCITHEDCPTNYYCDNSVCVPCGNMARCANPNNLIPVDIYDRCKFTCTNEKTCNKDGTDCCETCKSKAMTCCEDKYENASDLCTTPQDKTQTKMVGQWKDSTHTVCESVQKEYCPLTEEEPTDECSSCDKCHTLGSNGVCQWAKGLNGTYKAKCGEHCCTTTACNSDNTNCCKTVRNLAGGSSLCGLNYCWNSSKEFTVDSNQDMSLLIRVEDIKSFNKLSVCEKGGTCIVNYTSASGNINVWKPNALKKGKTYKIDVNLANQCDGCGISAVCAGASN